MTENSLKREFSFFARKMYNDGGLERAKPKGPLRANHNDGMLEESPLSEPSLLQFVKDTYSFFLKSIVLCSI